MVIQDGGCALSDEIEACGDLEPECSVEEIRPCGGLSDSMNGTTRNFILGLSLESDGTYLLQTQALFLDG